ncbi:glycosyltransferase [Paenibacillus sp. alder61]|uniref:glycosyltransferase family 2 protein n=1 Tax=Paenibacillus sp. alder61 TaxID=2862948 RepID=UPI001CD45617|nr:glycosyltransferase family 2 protein [Paenibacillus sp. alder61]MCA1296675.1 glycosyltransferase [Paenibacillus sp. alder61]
MLAFILARDTPPYLYRQTERSLLSVLPGIKIIVISTVQGGDCGEQINNALAASGEDWFLTFIAGEIVKPALAGQLEHWLRTVHSDTAGAVLDDASGSPSSFLPEAPVPRGPVLWRKEAVWSGHFPGFPTRSECPFDQYLFIDKQHQVSQKWKWRPLREELLIPSPLPPPPWLKEPETRKWILPLLLANDHDDETVGHDSHRQPPRISIVISSYNDGAYLPWSVRSVLAQSFSEWELILVDDGSTDDTAQIIQRLSGITSRIRGLTLPENRGKSHALNQALREARGEWVLELDADDWLAPGCCAELLEGAEAMPDAAVVWAQHVQWQERANKQLVLRSVSRQAPVMSPEDLLIRAEPLAPRLLKTAVLRELGGWNTAAPFAGRLYEDLELLLRIVRQSPVSFVPKPLYHRRIRRGSITHRQRQETYIKWESWMRDKLDFY